MNPGFERLAAYPFERLADLKAGLHPPPGLAHIPLSIGEPKHAPPQFVLDILAAHLGELGSYPATRGMPELRTAGARWLERRFGLGAGERRCRVDDPARAGHARGAVRLRAGSGQSARATAPLVLMPNPGYQIYEGAALLAGAAPWYLNTTAANGFLPDLDAVPAEIWHRCQVLFLCSPGNPVGSVMTLAYLQRALQLAEKHDFVIASDECYADIYDDESNPPPSLLTAAMAMGNVAARRCMTFHSLSKRSSLPGLRSGFVAGDAALIRPFLLYRTYHGCAMPAPTQRASIAAWTDDAHVAANRARYREQVRPGPAHPGAGDRGAPPCRRLLPVAATWATMTKRLRPGCIHGRTSPWCRAATWPDRHRRAIPAPAMCGSRSLLRRPNVCRLPTGFATTSTSRDLT